MTFGTRCGNIIKCYADMAELADAYGSGPYASNCMQVQVLLSAPKQDALIKGRLVIKLIVCAGVAELADAQDLGSCGNTVQVQVLSPAPNKDYNFDTISSEVIVLIFLFKSFEL